MKTMQRSETWAVCWASDGRGWRPPPRTIIHPLSRLQWNDISIWNRSRVCFDVFFQKEVVFLHHLLRCESHSLCCSQSNYRDHTATGGLSGHWGPDYCSLYFWLHVIWWCWTLSLYCDEKVLFTSSPNFLHLSSFFPPHLSPYFFPLSSSFQPLSVINYCCLVSVSFYNISIIFSTLSSLSSPKLLPFLSFPLLVSSFPLLSWLSCISPSRCISASIEGD